jgi:hypothetical protein
MEGLVNRHVLHRFATDHVGPSRAVVVHGRFLRFFHSCHYFEV